MSIFENLPDGTDIGVEITATDEDTTADLLFHINWDDSYATKSGRVFDFASDALLNYVEYDVKNNFFLDYYDFLYVFRCVKVTTEPVVDSKGYVRAIMNIRETVEDNTPDYEIFDTLYLSLTVTDLNQEVNEGTDTGNVLFFLVYYVLISSM